MADMSRDVLSPLLMAQTGPPGMSSVLSLSGAKQTLGKLSTQTGCGRLALRDQPEPTCRLPTLTVARRAGCRMHIIRYPQPASRGIRRQVSQLSAMVVKRLGWCYCTEPMSHNLGPISPLRHPYPSAIAVRLALARGHRRGIAGRPKRPEGDLWWYNLGRIPLTSWE